MSNIAISRQIASAGHDRPRRTTSPDSHVVVGGLQSYNRKTRQRSPLWTAESRVVSRASFSRAQSIYARRRRPTTRVNQSVQHHHKTQRLGKIRGIASGDSRTEKVAASPGRSTTWWVGRKSARGDQTAASRPDRRVSAYYRAAVNCPDGLSRLWPCVYQVKQRSNPLRLFAVFSATAWNFIVKRHLFMLPSYLHLTAKRHSRIF